MLYSIYNIWFETVGSHLDECITKLITISVSTIKEISLKKTVQRGERGQCQEHYTIDLFGNYVTAT